MTVSVSETAVPAAAPALRRPSLVGRTRAGLAEALAETGVPEKERRMRVGQLWNWIYHYGVRDFDAMTTIGKGLRGALAARFSLDLPKVTAEQVSTDGTRKWLMRMPATGPHDRGAEIECVYIPAGRPRHALRLQPGRLHAQLHLLPHRHAAPGAQPQDRGDRRADDGRAQPPRPNRKAQDGAFVPNDGGRFVSNIVFMGMGEPLYNFDGVRDAIAVISDDQGLSLGRRRITVSTSGVVPQIGPLGEEMGTMLAISLHAVRDELRNELVPLNKKYPIGELLEACRTYPGLSNAKRITFEYVMLKGVNNTDAEARELVRAQGHPGQDQPDPVQSLARHEIRCFGLGADRALLGDRLPRRLRLAGAHAARARHPRRLRAAQERDGEALRPRPADAGAGRDRGRAGRRGGVSHLALRWLLLIPFCLVASGCRGGADCTSCRWTRTVGVLRVHPCGLTRPR
ncbi:radical SAM protein [Streptomyces shaanxiensis]